MPDQKDVRLPLMVTPFEARAIDNYRYAAHIPSRAEAMRRLLRIGLAASPLLADLLKWLESRPEAGEPEMQASIVAIRKALGDG